VVARWGLGRRITALCAAAGVLLVIVALAATGTAAANRAQTARVLDQLGPAATNAEKLMSTALREQSAMRAYAANGRTADLDLYRAAVADERALDASTGRLLAGQPALLARLREATGGLAAWRTDGAEPLAARVAASGPSAALGTPDDTQRARFQRITAAIGGLQRAVTDARESARRSARRTGDLLVGLVVFAGVVVVLAGFALAVLLRRLVTRPVVDLAAEVRQVARGDYKHEIAVDGPPEVARLAHDVDAMRQQIVTDLALVRSAQEDLTRSNRDLEQFAYVASHDLQEPLRKVASFCQLLQRRYAGQLDERADQYIAFAVDGAQRMQRLINDLLAFSRIGRVTNDFTDVDIEKVVARIANEREGGVTWADLPTVRGDEALLTALLTNLVSNALKFRHPDRPPAVHVSARRVDGEWEISCADNGIGIEPEFAEKIFVIFQRLHPKDVYPGTGIGLAVAKKIVEYHGGHIWLDPDRRDGTLIRFTLPAEEAAS